MTKKLLRTGISALACALCFAAGAHAVEAPLSWDEVRKLARDQNPSLASARLSRDSATSSIKAAYGDFLPKLSLNGNRTRSITSALGIDTRATNVQYGASASLNLFNGFTSFGNLRRSQAVEKESDANFQLTSVNLRHDLRIAYLNIYIIQERLKLAEQDLKRVDQNNKLMELKYNSGAEARWNLKTTQADLANARYNVESNQAALRNAREALAALLEVPALPDRAVATPDESAFKTTVPAEDLVVGGHPDFLRSHFAGERTYQDIRLARANFFPTIDLTYSRSYNDSRPDLSAAYQSDSRAFAITANWNIFNGTSDYFRVQAANIAHEAAELSTASTERTIRSNLRTKAEAYRINVARVPVMRAKREAAAERERTVSAQYRAGLKTYLDWESAESALLTAEQDEINALATSLTSFAELEQSIGLTLEQP